MSTALSISGARSTTDISSSQRIVNLDEDIKMVLPAAAPFTTLLQQTRKRATGDPKFKWFEDDLKPRFDAINDGGGYTSSNTSLTVDNGTYFAEHDIVLITRTGEQIRVTQVVGNVLTVVRGVGTTSAAAINNDDELMIASSAQPEGDVAKTARSNNGTEVYNYTQIFREPYEVTQTSYVSENETNPHDWDHLTAKKMMEHKRELELAGIFGQRSENTSGGEVRRTTAGLLAQITTNITDAGGAFTETEFNTAMRTAFSNKSGSGAGAKTKVAFGSPLATQVLNSYPASKVHINTSGEAKGKYGIDFTTFTSPFGAIRLVTHWELTGTKYGGYLVIADMGNVEMRFLKGPKGSRDTHVRKEIQAPSADSRLDEVLTECGFQVACDETHSIVSGITG